MTEKIVINLVTVLLLMSLVGLGLTFVFLDFAESYNVEPSEQDLSNMQVFLQVQNLTSEITSNVQETGIVDESSNAKIISVGWNSIKLVTKTPGIMMAYLTGIGNTVGMSVAGIDVIDTIITIIIITLMLTLVFIIFLGRSPN